MKRNDLYDIIYTVLLFAVCIITFFFNNRTIFFGKESYDIVIVHRIITTATATIFVFFSYLLAKEISGREDFAWISSLLLCTSYRLILYGRIPTNTLCCHALMAGALFFIFCTFKERQGSWISAILGGGCLGVSFLCDEWLSFYLMLIPFVVVLLLFCRPLEWKRARQLLVLLLVALAVGSLVYIKPDFLNTATGKYIFGRKCMLWNNSNSHTWYFYGRILWSTGVWSLLFLTSLLVPLWTKELKNKTTYLIGVTWFALQFVILMAAPYKNENYLSPLMISICYAMASILINWKDTLNKHSNHIVEKFYLFNGYTLATICLLLPVVGYWMVYKAGYMIFDRYLLLSIYTLVASGCIFVATWKRTPYFIVYSITIILLVGEIMM